MEHATRFFGPLVDAPPIPGESEQPCRGAMDANGGDRSSSDRNAGLVASRRKWGDWRHAIMEADDSLSVCSEEAHVTWGDLEVEEFIKPCRLPNQHAEQVNGTFSKPPLPKREKHVMQELPPCLSSNGHLIKAVHRPPAPPPADRRYAFDFPELPRYPQQHKHDCEQVGSEFIPAPVNRPETLIGMDIPSRLLPMQDFLHSDGSMSFEIPIAFWRHNPLVDEISEEEGGQIPGRNEDQCTPQLAADSGGAADMGVFQDDTCNLKPIGQEADEWRVDGEFHSMGELIQERGASFPRLGSSCSNDRETIEDNALKQAVVHLDGASEEYFLKHDQECIGKEEAGKGGVGDGQESPPPRDRPGTPGVGLNHNRKGIQEGRRQKKPRLNPPKPGQNSFRIAEEKHRCFSDRDGKNAKAAVCDRTSGPQSDCGMAISTRKTPGGNLEEGNISCWLRERRIGSELGRVKCPAPKLPLKKTFQDPTTPRNGNAFTIGVRPVKRNKKDGVSNPNKDAARTGLEIMKQGECGWSAGGGLGSSFDRKTTFGRADVTQGARELEKGKQPVSFWSRVWGFLGLGRWGEQERESEHPRGESHSAFVSALVSTPCETMVRFF